jgi:hypothetical protein
VRKYFFTLGSLIFPKVECKFSQNELSEPVGNCATDCRMDKMEGAGEGEEMRRTQW